MSAPLTNLPALRSDSNLAIYLREIRRFPMLQPEEEYTLAKSWRDEGDIDAAHKLVTSHLRLVAKIAMGYRGYGLPISDLIAEGNLGMMQAVKRFDPDKGFRLATYAMWWIRAAMQEYILRSWSLVKIGTTAAQKRLFFNLNRMKKEIRALDNGSLTPEQVKHIAHRLAVTEDEVEMMNGRLHGGDQSLNAPMRTDSPEGGEWQDWLVDETDNQETKLSDEQELTQRQRLLSHAMESLTPRERDIIVARRLTETPMTLEDLSARYTISRERVRQIEVRAFAKLQSAIQKEAATLLPPPSPPLRHCEERSDAGISEHA